MFNLLAFVLVLSAGNAPDCPDRLPDSLKKVLLRSEPNLRLLRLQELPISYSKNGCYLVTEGDYNGDGKRDYAVLLSNEKDTESKLFVALAAAESWSLKELPTFTESARYGWVSSGKGGTRTSEWAFSKPPFWVEKLLAKNDVLYCGRQESGYFAFAIVEGDWRGMHEGD